LLVEHTEHRNDRAGGRRPSSSPPMTPSSSSRWRATHRSCVEITRVDTRLELSVGKESEGNLAPHGWRDIADLCRVATVRCSGKRRHDDTPTLPPPNLTAMANWSDSAGHTSRYPTSTPHAPRIKTDIPRHHSPSNVGGSRLRRKLLNYPDARSWPDSQRGLRQRRRRRAVLSAVSGETEEEGNNHGAIDTFPNRRGRGKGRGDRLPRHPAAD
jgi:hypothetical protein